MLETALRARPLFAAIGAAVVLTAGGAAWAAWHITGSQSLSATATTSLDLRLVGRPSPNQPLFPGAQAGLTVTVHNDNPFPVVVTQIRPGNGSVTADAAHRDDGCGTTGVALTKSAFPVTWSVPANGKASFGISKAIRMGNNSDSACQGATFTVPLAASGRSDAH
ncbi:hypothetical protein [Actinoplanes xinjiangensis]|uniref:hypothetical protein n=1 Tax=Actinoplanes xinjiangensis TaxID=512350 RepID=UPI00342DA2A3